MNDLLDERRPLFADAVLADAALVEHSAVCSACASIARGYETLCDGVSTWERVDVSADLTSRVISQWELAKALSLANSTLAISTDWDSAELPALRPVGLQRAMPTAAQSDGFWTSRRELVLAGAVLATAAALLVISGVGQTPNANDQAAIAQGPSISTGSGVVARDTSKESSSKAIAVAPVVHPAAQHPSTHRPVAPQFALTSLPIVGQMTESYRPLLEETDRTVRKSLGLRATSDGQMITSAAAMGLVTQPDLEESDTSWDSLVPDQVAQVAPVTQSAVRSVVALLRVLPGVEPPVNQ